MTTKVSAFFDRCWEQVSYLHDRWQDEKEYEDWQDYIDSATKLVEKSGLEFIGLSYGQWVWPSVDHYLRDQKEQVFKP